MATLTELAQRTADAGNLTVTLAVDLETDRLQVDVEDRRFGETFTVAVPEGVKPLDVYNHPFAYRED